MKAGIGRIVVAVLFLIGAGFARAQGTAQPPKGAIVLFDGKDLSQWVHPDGAAEVNPETKDIITKQKFSDFTLHAEFWVPKLAPEVKGQARGNSGIFLV